MKKSLLGAGFMLVLCCSLLLFAPSPAKAEGACQHVNVYDDIAYDADGNPRCGYKNDSSVYHLVTFEWQHHCADCGATIGEPFYDWEEYWLEPHTLNEDFECTLCGYKELRVEISEENFPDEGLRAHLQTMDGNHDGFISAVECLSWINIENEIHSLQGLELLPVITLGLSNAQGVIDLSFCPNVESVNVSGCKALTRLDLGQNTKLKSIFAEGSSITTLDVTQCPELTVLRLSGSSLSSLDLRNNLKIQSISAGSTPLESILFGPSPDLIDIDVSGCHLKGLDVTMLPNLEVLYAGRDVNNHGNNTFPSIDVSQNPKLKDLRLDTVTATSLDVSNNPLLGTLELGECGNLVTLDVTNCPNLQYLSCCSAKVKTLDLSQNPLLEFLYLYGFSDLSALDMSYCPNLEYLSCTMFASMKTLDLSQNTRLNFLELSGCYNLATLDVTLCPNLKYLYCNNTAVETLDLSQNSQLISLLADGCQLGWLDISANTGLGNVTAYNNTYYLKPKNGKLDLTTLQGFDASRASEWRGGTVSGNTLTFQDYEVSFTYDLGQGRQERFKWVQGGRTDSYTYRLMNDGTVGITRCFLTGNVVIPETVDGYTVTNLGDNLFRFSGGVTSVTVPKTVTSLGTAPGNLLAYVFLGSGLKQILVASGNPAFVSVDGVLYSKDMATLYQYPLAKAGEEFHIPESVTWIDCGGFSMVEQLRRVYIEGKETSWAMATFATNGCPLTVYYRKGGRTEIRINQAIENNQIMDEYFNWPSYMSYGDDGETGQFAYDAKADEVIQSVITGGMNDVQKARALHDYIITHAHYTMKYDDETGILVYGEGHCQGYSKTFKLLLDKAGIESRLVMGSSRETFIGHMWNQIKIGNVWYHVDCTWDDPTYPGCYDQEAVSGMEQQTYFMVSTQFILRDHIWYDPGDDLSGWAVENGATVYHDLSGQKVTGWLTVDGHTFYFDANGKSVQGLQVIDGKTYMFDAVSVFTDSSGNHIAAAVSRQDLPTPDLSLPVALTSVEAEAFAGIRNVVVWVPGTVEYIAADAFDSSVTILCPADSYAESRSEELGLECVTEKDL